jgi:hypothetical protein
MTGIDQADPLLKKKRVAPSVTSGFTRWGRKKGEEESLGRA